MRLCRDFALRTRRIRQDALLEEKKKPDPPSAGWGPMAGGRLMFAITAAPRVSGSAVDVGTCGTRWSSGSRPCITPCPSPYAPPMRAGALREADAVRRACASIGFSRLVLPTRESCAHGPWQRGADASAPALADTGAFRSFPSKRAAAQRRENPWTGLNAKLSEALREARRPDNFAFSLGTMAARAVFASLPMPARAYAPASGQSPPCPWAPVRVRAQEKKKATPRHVPWGRARLAVRRKKKLP